MDSTDEEALKAPIAVIQVNDLVTATDKSVREQQKADEGTDSKRLKCVVVGDPLVGKTSLIYAFSKASSISENSRHLLLPGLMEVQEKKVLCENTNYTLVIHDTDYSKESRLLAYANADLIILCYSVADCSSLLNVERKWLPELKESATNLPLMLIGNKVDLRETGRADFYMNVVGEFEGVNLSAAIDSQAWFECSARTMENINRVFEEIPPSVERHHFHKVRVAQNAPSSQQAVATISSSTTRRSSWSVIPILKQSYQNIVACWSNPGAFVEKKRTIVSYMPLLKAFIPYEEEVNTARESAPPVSNSVPRIVQQQLKRLLQDKSSSEEDETQPKRRRNDDSDK